MPRVRSSSEKGASLIEVLVAIIAILSAFSAAFLFVDSRHAQKNDLDLLSNKFEIKIVLDDITKIQTQIWQLEDRVKESPNLYDETLKDIRELEHKMESLKTEHESLVNKKNGA